MKAILLAFFITVTNASQFDRLVGDSERQENDIFSIINISVGNNRNHYDEKTRFFNRNGSLLCKSEFSRKIINKRHWRYDKNFKIFVRDGSFFTKNECRILRRTINYRF